MRVYELHLEPIIPLKLLAKLLSGLLASPPAISGGSAACPFLESVPLEVLPYLLKLLLELREVQGHPVVLYGEHVRVILL